MQTVGSAISAVSTLIFGANVILGWRIALATFRRYTLESLLALPEEEDDYRPESVSVTMAQDFEDAEGGRDRLSFSHSHSGRSHSGRSHSGRGLRRDHWGGTHSVLAGDLAV